MAVDKPEGWTSHDVVAVARRAFAVRRVGHGGTLDPLATGVLPLLVGHATTFVERLHAAPKVYAALVLFGSETSTDDREGAPTRTAAVPALERDGIDAALGAFRGDIAQVPPARSAVKVGGRRAYTLARAGRDVPLEARTVRVERLDVASWRPPALRLLIVCGSGTYIRSIARDLGRAVGSAAHLGRLRRLAVGALDAGRAVEAGRLRAVTPTEAVSWLRPADDRLLDLDDRFRSAPAAALLEGWETA